MLVARQMDRLAAVAAEVEAQGRDALAISADVGDAPQVEDLTQQALARFGPIDLLVNNAGIWPDGLDATNHACRLAADHEHQLLGYVYTIQALLPQFVQRGSGSIVNVGSFGGKMPLPQMTAYCASKYAVTGLTDSLRLELSPQGIHVGAVHPGLINSDLFGAGAVSRRRPAIAGIGPESGLGEPASRYCQSYLGNRRPASQRNCSGACGLGHRGLSAAAGSNAVAAESGSLGQVATRPLIIPSRHRVDEIKQMVRHLELAALADSHLAALVI